MSDGPVFRRSIKRIRGQISCLPANAESGQLRTVLCAKGYVAPPRDGTHTLGASFNFQQTDDAPSIAEHQANLEMLEQISSDLYQRLQADPQQTAALQGRVAFRCTSPDYLPLIGPLAAPQAFADTYAALAQECAAIPARRLPVAGGPVRQHRPWLARL